MAIQAVGEGLAFLFSVAGDSWLAQAVVRKAQGKGPYGKQLVDVLLGEGPSPVVYHGAALVQKALGKAQIPRYSQVARHRQLRKPVVGGVFLVRANFHPGARPAYVGQGAVGGEHGLDSKPARRPQRKLARLARTGIRVNHDFHGAPASGRPTEATYRP